jgi:glyoxylase-like metal-dependent hydrolase (beta-lactamase superfamily II)
MKNPLSTILFAALGAVTVACYAQADDRFANVEVKAIPVAGSVHMLIGSGGNIGVSAGSDGLLLIDDQYAPLAKKIMATLSGISEKSPSYIINTHYHGDHTGSNAFFKENQGATIFAHENVRIRLANAKDANKAALPVVTYQDGIKFHLNEDTIHVFHLANGHTDGDSVVWFENADVLHTGDLFFKDMFPYIDLGAGGSVKGYIESVEDLLGRIDDDTKIIPGHGPAVASKSDLARFVTMMKETHSFVKAKKAAGMSEEQVLEAGLEAKWDSWAWAFINEERWIKTLYPE